MKGVILAALALVASVATAHGQAVLTWNVKEGSIEQITRREGDVGRLGAQLRDQLSGSLPEIVVLQEVTSYAAAARVARALGYTTATVATSDSGNDREIWPFALEIAVITPRPVISVTSIQSRADDRFPPFIADVASGTVSYGKAERAVVPAAIRLPEGETIPRAILRVEIEGGTVVYGVHLNSSGLGFCRLQDALKGASELRKRAEALGLAEEATAIEQAMERVKTEIGRARRPGIEATKLETLRRARSREAAAGVIAKWVAKDLAAGRNVFVAGDFNTPLNEPCKTGTKLDQDFEPMMGCDTRIEPSACGTTDGFDDTYAILTGGLIKDVRLTTLTKDLGRTYVSTRFANSPIDNILAGGPAGATTYEVSILKESGSQPAFGSDHYPVLARPR